MLTEKQQHLLEQVQKFVDPSFKIPEGMPIPLKDFIYAKRVGNDSTQSTEAGVILVPSNAVNVKLPHTAVVYAVSPYCSEYLIPGIKIYYNPFVDVEVMINGTAYLKMHENTDVWGILPPKAWVYEGIKTASQVDREKTLGQWEGFEKRKAHKDLNDFDKKTEIEKKLRKTTKK